MQKLIGLLISILSILAISFSAFAGEWKTAQSKWCYDSGNGNYYKSGKKEIDGKTYAFDNDGFMITGFTDSSYTPINGTGYDAACISTYYFDPDGAMHKDWLKVDKAGAPSQYDDYSELWFYYDSSGKKVANTNGGDYAVRNIGGEKYAFDENGVLAQGWGTSSTDKQQYISDGKVTTGWKQMVPPVEINEEDNAAGTLRWFYFTSQGELVKDCCKRIGSTYYLFNKEGILSTGLKYLKSGSVGTSKYSDWGSISTSTEDNWLALIEHDGKYSGKDIYYFTENGMQKGNKTISYDGTNHTLKFDGSGKACSGVKGNKLYVNGGLVTSVEDKYVAAYDTECNEYVVDKGGSILGKGRVASDYNGYWAVNQIGTIGFFDTDDKTTATTWAKGDDDYSYGDPTFIN